LTDWTGRRVLLTGANGFIGSRLARTLAADGAALWAGIRGKTTARLPSECTTLHLDLTDAQSIRDAVGAVLPDVVFHLAASGVSNPAVAALDALKVNTVGTVNLLETLCRHQPQRIILVGTCHEYGTREGVEGLDPANFYAASKIAAWAFARAYWRSHQLPVVVARLFQVYGPGQPARMLVPSAIRAARADRDFPMTAGEQTRDFIIVTDVVEGLIASAEAPDIEGASLDIGTGKAHSIRSVVELIWRQADARGNTLPGALPTRPGEAVHLVADAFRTAELTGWRARVGIEEGIRQTIDEFKQRDQE